MIAYGYEEPIAITPTEVFNPTTANMVLQSMNQYSNLLRKDYEEAIDRQEEFLKEYGGFTSPIEADVDNYYKMTVGGLGNLFDAAQKQGVDLTRSAEGRAMIQRYIMSRPYGDLAKLRESSKNAELYNQIYGKMLSEGLVSPEMAKAMDGNMAEWNTLQNGTWDKISPIKYQSYIDLVDPMYQNLKKELSLLRQEGMYDIYGISDKRLDEVLTEGIEDIAAKPQSQYYIDHVFGGDKDAFRQKLRGVLKNELREERILNEERKIKYQEGQANHRARMANSGGGHGGGGTSGKNPMFSSYRMEAWRSAMGMRGFKEDGSDYEIRRKTMAYNAIKNMKVYVKSDGKTYKFSELTDKSKQEVLRGHGAVAKKYKEVYDNFNTYAQADLMNDWVNKGKLSKQQSGSQRGKYYGNASLALAFRDDASSFALHYGDDDVYYSADGHSLGFNTRNKYFYDISELTARSGFLAGRTARKYSRFDNTRRNIEYFTIPTSSDGKDMIVQYEHSGGGRHHLYRKVNAHMKDGSERTMWVEAWDPERPDTYESSVHDLRVLHENGQGVKTVESPILTSNYGYVE